MYLIHTKLEHTTWITWGFYIDKNRLSRLNSRMICYNVFSLRFAKRERRSDERNTTNEGWKGIMRIKSTEVSRPNVCMDQTIWPTFCNRNQPDCLQQPSCYHRSWIIAVLKNNKLLCENFLLVWICAFYAKSCLKKMCNVWSNSNSQ